MKNGHSVYKLVTVIKIWILISSLSFVYAASDVRKSYMNKELSLNIKCEGGTKCNFKEKDLFFSLIITNNSHEAIGFPLDFLKKRGPSVKLINPKTKQEIYLRTNPANLGLQEKFTEIKPNQSVTFEWLIHPQEIQSLSESPIYVEAEVRLFGKGKINNSQFDFDLSKIIVIQDK